VGDHRVGTTDSEGTVASSKSAMVFGVVGATPTREAIDLSRAKVHYWPVETF